MQNCFTVEIAGIVIQIEPVFCETIERFKDYIVDDKAPDFRVSVSKDEIDAERRLNDLPDDFENPSWLEQIAIQRAIAEKLPVYDAILVHGSSIAVDGKAYIFMAPSGTGKSTHVSLWRELLAEKALMINDDKPFIRMIDDVPYVCGNPWMGKHRLGNNVMVPLKAICLLDRSPENHIEAGDKEECLPRLFSHIYRPSGAEELSMTLAVLNCILKKAAVCKLGCNMDISAAEMSYEYMSKSME